MRLTRRELLRLGWGPPPPSPPATGYRAVGPVSDQEGRAVLALPAGFTYVTFGHIGRPMADGSAFPHRPDGMAAFQVRTELCG